MEKLPSRPVMRQFLADVESGDPLKDFYSEDQLIDWLVAFMRQALSVEA